MPGENLTRDEARNRAANLTTDSYSVALDLTGDATTFRSRSTITFAASAGQSTFVDLIAPRVRSITLNGTALDPASSFDGTRVELTGLAEKNTVVIDADCAYMRTGEGLHRFIDPVDKSPYLYTQFEVIDARRMYACFDQPDLKATFQFDVTAPADWQIVSNAPTPEPTEHADATATWSFEATPRISTYITALIAGPYHVERFDHGGIPMAVLCRQSLAQHLDAEEIIDVTKRGFDFFESVFDQPYPFSKYDQIFVPEFNAGAMENAGAVTFLEDYVFRSKVTDTVYERRAETILHELAHMWFGDLVTMRWWDDLWLNESFATFASVMCQSEATRWTNAWTTFANLEKTWAYRQDQLSSTHPIAADIRDIEDVEVNFDGITYAKGASVLKQLVAWVGRDEFIQGVRQYFRDHAWGNTELQDLLRPLEEVSGRDLSGWSKEWLETAGVNLLRPSFDLDRDGCYTRFAVQQEAEPRHPRLRSHRMAIGLYDHTDAGLVRRQRIELDIVGESTDVPQLAGVRQPDLLLLNDDDLTYAKVRLDPRSLATLVASMSEITDPLARTLCWAAAWDMTRDAEMTTGDFVALVLKGVSTETDIGVAQTVLRQAASALHSYAAPDRREPGLSALADRLVELAEAAAPGSDQQLAFVNLLAQVARTDTQLDLLAGLFDGSRSLPSLAIDADLRWTLLQRLVAMGRFGDDSIEAELDRDATATGQRRAAAAWALRPTAVAKEQAWAAAVDGNELPNALLGATVAGLALPDHRELMRPFVDRYFSAVENVWTTRTNETAQTVVVGLYPGSLIEQATVDLTDAFVGRPDLSPALKRLLVEGRDSVSRALRAREYDGAH
ncbi:MAG: aminopeptidase N [Actinomycetes bacterium]